MKKLSNTYILTMSQRKVFAIITLALALTHSQVVEAAKSTEPITEPAEVLQGIIVQSDTDIVADVEESLPAVRTLKTTMTAYSSTPGQTDSTPFVTASGSCVRDSVVASNYFRIGTKIRLPELYGDKIFVVEDRMNARYTNRVDVWMKDIADARKFGLKRNVHVEVVEEGDGVKHWNEGWTNTKCQQLAKA